MKIEMVSIHFWILHIIFTLAIFAGLLYRISTVLQGSVDEFGLSKSRVSSLNRMGKFWYFVGKFFKTLFSRKFWPITRTVILDSILHVRLARDNILKWFGHTLVFWGILFLFILSILSGIAVEIAPLFGYQAGSSLFIDAMADKDFWVTAVLNELLNAIIILGIIIVFIRGFITKKKIGMMMFQDVFLIVFIIIILISGWFTEAIRYIIERTPAYIARLGFIGFWLSRLLVTCFPDATEPEWVINYEVFWHMHVIVIWLAFIYIPFSKFAHALFSPVASVINVMEREKDIEEKNAVF